MGIFSASKDLLKEEKRQRVVEHDAIELIRDYNLDEKNKKIVTEIMSELHHYYSNIELQRIANLNSSSATNELILLDSLVKQNWLIIQKLEEISNKLDK